MNYDNSDDDIQCGKRPHRATMERKSRILFKTNVCSSFVYVAQINIEFRLKIKRLKD